MSDASCNAAIPASARAAWQADDGLAAALADASTVRLVLAADAARVLDATAGGWELIDRLGRPGTLPAGIAGQILRAAGPSPRLLRLRLDPRGVATPTVCRLARAADADGQPLYLLVVDGSLPGQRGPAARPNPAVAPAGPRADGRFLWRTDPSGALTPVSGEADALADVSGRSWEALAREGRLNGEVEALLSALSESRTFRALRIEVRFDQGPALAAALSGAPMARAGQPFAGFGGFGIVQAGRAVSQAGEAARQGEPLPSPAPEARRPGGPTVQPSRSAALPGDPLMLASMVTPFFAAWIGQAWFGGSCDTPADRQPGPDRAIAPIDTCVPGGPAENGEVPASAAAAASTEGDAAAEAEASKAPAEPSPSEPSPSEPSLSMTEHAAFREIARALGARYAGDEEAEAGRPDARFQGGSVTPFPGAWLPAEFEPAAILEGVPGPVLVHRGGSILAANRTLLALVGYADLQALREAGLDGLFRGLPPERHQETGETTVAIAAADGATRPVALTRGAMPWPGGVADCLLLRPISADDPESRDVAEDLVRKVREARGADALAALDAIEDGVALLDRAGRVLALNRAAAALFACDPREVVGGAFGDLFAPEVAPMARAVLDGLPGGASLRIAGRAMTLRAAPLPGDRWVAVLRADEVKPDTGEVAAFARRFLGALDRGIRTPLTAILGFADVMLKEPYGPLGHPRYRGYLQDIRASGDQVLGLVGDLTDLAAIEAGGLSFSRRSVTLNDLIAACVADSQAEAARRRIVLRTSFAEDLAPLDADEPSLARAARIAIGNAIRLTGAGGQVIVSTGPAEAGTIALRVRDTGAGLTPEEIARALDPFAGEAVPPEIGGLGLPLMRALVSANDGALHISSRKDEGTLVEIRFPAARAAKRA